MQSMTEQTVVNLLHEAYKWNLVVQRLERHEIQCNYDTLHSFVRVVQPTILSISQVCTKRGGCQIAVVPHTI